ncbi:MAG TPA: BON domain-containing protein [Candidatus Methylomirabilis sp.]
MARGTMIAMVVSLGMLAAPGFVAQGTASSPVGSTERTVKDAGKTATREVTDSWLTLQTKLALLADERVSSADVHVTTQRGVIALRGKVDSEAQQQAAGEIARTIEGARDVSNQLTVVPQPQRKAADRQDHQIVKDVNQEIKNDGRLKHARIHVRSNEGIVTLTGKAPSLETSVRASETTRRVPGVRAVRNELTF